MIGAVLTPEEEQAIHWLKVVVSRCVHDLSSCLPGGDLYNEADGERRETALNRLCEATRDMHEYVDGLRRMAQIRARNGMHTAKETT